MILTGAMTTLSQSKQSQDMSPATGTLSAPEAALSARLRAAQTLPEAPLAMPIQDFSATPLRLFGRSSRQRPAIRP